MDELIAKLTQQLGINADQARGGAGLVMKMIQDNLDEESLAKIKSFLPDFSTLVDAAPSDDDAGGLGGMLGDLAGSILGDAGGAVGKVSELVAGFSKLDIDPGSISEFITTILGFFQEKGGDEVNSLLAGILE